MAEICVYMTSVSSKLQISKQQRAILDFLDARGIEYRPVDMCANLKARGQMLEKLPEESKPEGKQILPPQVFNGEDYCGDYEQFFDAREMDLIYSFFKLNPPEGSSVSKKLVIPLWFVFICYKHELKQLIWTAWLFLIDWSFLIELS